MPQYQGADRSGVPDSEELIVLRRLVVNADDLGLTVGVNNGIFDAHDDGVLTSASVFANARATDDAFTRALRRPSLGVGCHLTLVDGQPTLPAARVPSLIEDDGQFRRSWKPFIVSCLLGRISLREVERELTAQIDRIRSAGLTLTHLHAHKRVHARLLDARAHEVDLLTHPDTFDLLMDQRIALIRHDLSLSEQRSLRHVS